MNAMVRKTTSVGFDDGMKGVLSDMTKDAYGDVVGDPDDPMLGWDISTHSRNPIALWSHNSQAPIGTWKGVHVADYALRGTLHLAPSGSTRLIDEIRALVEANVLRAISVGFMPVKSRPLTGTGGVHWLRMILSEASLVSVPANPSALMEARSLGISGDTIQKVFVPPMTVSIATQIREVRRHIARAKQNVANARTDYQRSIHQRTVESFQRWEAQLIAKVYEPPTPIADLEAMQSALNADLRQVKAEIQRAAERERDPWGWHQARQATIDGFTRTHNATVPQDPPPFQPSEGGYGTWRGVKLPGPTWRGKPTR